MVDDPAEFVCSLLRLLAHLVQMLRKCSSMTVSSNSSGYVSPAPALSWQRLAELPAAIMASKRPRESSSDPRVHPVEDVIHGATSTACKEENSQLEKVSCSHEEDDQGKQCRAMVQKLDVENKMQTPRRRPARIVIPKPCDDLGFGVAGEEKYAVEKELEVEGNGYFLASRQGQRHMLEDGYGVIADIHGDSKQAFFGVFDGHGGRAAVDFVSGNLGNNIIAALDELEKQENQTELAIKAGYSTTDREVLSQGISNGACAATVLLKDGELHVANVGDCRVVMSRKGVAIALTDDHRAGREDERRRIENSGGYVTCHNGIWRVQDSLAVSRAIGDKNMKDWIISEPETKKVQLTPDCEFLVMASDGLWDKVTNQEAVDVVSKHSISMKSCKELIEISCGRGNRDDITVMVIDLQKFVQFSG